MGYYRLVKDGPTIDNILKCFNTWDFSTYPTIESYVNTFIGGAIWGNIRGTLTDQTDLANALSAKANDVNVVHLAGPETITGSKTFEGLSLFNNMAYFYDGYSLGNYTNIFDSGTAGVINFQYSDTGGNVNSYLKIPNAGTSNNPVTIATTNDLTDLVHKGSSSSPSNETIYGVKTFEDKIKLNWTDPTETDINRISQIIANQKGLTTENMYVGEFEYNFTDNNDLSDTNVAAIKLFGKSIGTREYRINLAHPNSGLSGVDWYSLKLPLVGSTDSPATLATTEDCGTKLYKHTFSHIASEGPTLDYIITATSTPYDFTGTQGPISQIGKDALKIVTSGAITLGLSQTDEFKGQIAVITGYTIASYNLIFNSGGTTIDTVSPL